MPYFHTCRIMSYLVEQMGHENRSAWMSEAQEAIHDRMAGIFAPDALRGLHAVWWHGADHYDFGLYYLALYPT